MTREVAIGLGQSFLPVRDGAALRQDLAQKLPFKTVSSILGRKQKLPAGWRAVHRSKVGGCNLASADRHRPIEKGQTSPP